VVLAHRVVWSVAFLAFFLAAPAARRRAFSAVRQPRLVALLALSGSLVASNWLAFISAVSSGHTLEVSLGYYMNPLLTISLGVFVLRESFRRW